MLAPAGATTDIKGDGQFNSVFNGKKSNTDFVVDFSLNTAFSNRKIGLTSLTPGGTFGTLNFNHYAGTVGVNSWKSYFGSKIKATTPKPNK